MSFSFSSEQKQSIIWLGVGLALVLLLFLLAPVLMPFIVSAILAYILNPAVDRLSQIRVRRFSISRSMASSAVILLLILTSLAMVLILVPVLKKELPLLQSQLPRFLDRLDQFSAPLLAKYHIPVRLDGAGLKALLTDQLSTSGEEIGKAILSSLKVGGTAVIGIIGNLLLIPVVLFYLLLDWHHLIDRIRHFIPRRWIASITKAVTEVDDLMAQYLRGQILVMVILAVFYAVALALVGFDLALPVGIMTGLLVFIPYIGYGLGLALAMIGAILQYDSLNGILAVAAVYTVGQLLESFVLTPRLVGERIGLHPLTVIFALMAFGELFGFTGILMALPVSAVMSVGVSYLRRYYLNSSFYRQ